MYLMYIRFKSAETHRIRVIHKCIENIQNLIVVSITFSGWRKSLLEYPLFNRVCKSTRSHRNPRCTRRLSVQLAVCEMTIKISAASRNNDERVQRHGREMTFRSQQPRNSRTNFQSLCVERVSTTHIHMHAMPLKRTFWGTRRDAFNIFIANTLDCARHFHRIGRVNASTDEENEKSRQRDARREISMSNSFISRRTSHGNPGFRTRFVPFVPSSVIIFVFTLLSDFALPCLSRFLFNFTPLSFLYLFARSASQIIPFNWVKMWNKVNSGGERRGICSFSWGYNIREFFSESLLMR